LNLLYKYNGKAVHQLVDMTNTTFKSIR